MANKKRTSLDALSLGKKDSSTITRGEKSTEQHLPNLTTNKRSTVSASTERKKSEIAKTTVYVPKPVFEQWRELAFTERKKMHDYLLEGIDRVFANRGLKSISELTDKK